MNQGKVDVLLGLQWGDEGKGKVVDVLTPQYDVIARFQGGPNAGHTLEFEGQKYIAYARIIGETKAQIEVVEDKGDLISSLTAKDGLMVSPIHDATDLDREVATGNLADCCVRVINGEVFIAALTRDGGFVLDKLEWK